MILVDIKWGGGGSKCGKKKIQAKALHTFCTFSAYLLLQKKKEILYHSRQKQYIYSPFIFE